ncbi:MAG: FeoA domain-containing protein [Gemmatimonadota bacterium]
MGRFIEWPWSESLGGIQADEGRDYVVHRILFGLVRDRCGELGLMEGVTLRCRRQADDEVVVELGPGNVLSLDRACSWFVHVRPADAVDSRHDPVPRREGLRPQAGGTP